MLVWRLEHRKFPPDSQTWESWTIRLSSRLKGSPLSTPPWIINDVEKWSTSVLSLVDKPSVDFKTLVEGELWSPKYSALSREHIVAKSRTSQNRSTIQGVKSEVNVDGTRTVKLSLLTGHRDVRLFSGDKVLFVLVDLWVYIEIVFELIVSTCHVKTFPKKMARVKVKETQLDYK